MVVWISAQYRPAMVVLAAALVVPGVQGAEQEIGEGKLSITGSSYLGTAVRIDEQDPKLLADANSSLVGIPGLSVTPAAGRNGDDGNLNFDRGDQVATVLKGYLSLSYTWRDYGIEASGQAWYDYATADANRPWGNVPNDYVAGQPLSDDGALARSQFSGVALDNLYGHGHHQFDDRSVDWKLGWQSLDWGKRLTALGGLRDLNPIDVPASLRPGVDREHEARITFPAVFGRLALSPATSVEAFYQLQFEPTALNGCGAFYSSLDFMAEGCDKAMFGPLSDRAAIATGIYVRRTATQDPSDSGQGGVALRHTVESWATELGFFATQFHSRAPFYSGTKSGRVAGPLFLPGDPGNLNPTYFTEYPEDIRMFGATFESKWRGGMVVGEITYRPNQPLQYNSHDVISAAVSRTAPTPLRDKSDALAPGETLRAWESHKALQLQLGVAGGLPRVLGYAGMSYGAELVYKLVPDLPNVSVTRFGRAEVFGQGPVDGVCPPPAASVSCSSDGYVSQEAFGYRLRAGLKYPKAVGELDLIPSVMFGQDVWGWSGDLMILEGRMFAAVSLQAVLAGHWTAAIVWNPTWGGTYNSLRDRSTAQAYVSFQF
jgi:Protein of unknown function (DUF1302)